jgi:competence protein ComEC
MFVLREGDWLTKLERFVYSPRFAFERVLSRMYPEPEAGLAKGLLLGGNSYLSEKMKGHFGRLGLSHIVAVSGYNIVLIVQAILFLGILLGFWRRQAIVLSLAGSVFFIFIIGMPASAVRAGLMAGAAFGAFFLQRISYSLAAVLLAASVMLLYQPLYLWYDAGFQLSFLATLAVIYAMSWYELFLHYKRFGKGFVEIVWLAVAVQLFLWPILVYHFGFISWLSLVANILFLPVVPLAMLISFLAGLIVMIVPPVAGFIGWIGYFPLTFITRGAEILSTLPWSVSEAIHLPLWAVLLWYGLLTGMVGVGEKYRIRKKYVTAFTCPHYHG